eukprot:CAMPEP_0197867124 /NCGR_PEP_ID=MMETSP1438-20131217/44587_1 /TAXON_ID=1461541 /ORGANISM="Pterosperma sp., Strain CCMP1384" /LENGTH=444 /DNA_ID=CAMNT_0043485747 /DNA_START=252 /DNA_END=1586 /DNA_ORIENTATION=-
MSSLTELSDDQQDVLTSLNVVFSGASCIGSGFIIVCFIAFKDLRKFSFQLVFWLSVSDLINGLGNLFGNPEPGVLCSLQAYTTQFFSIASILWTTVIAYVLHRTVVQHCTDVANLGRKFHLYVWITSLVATILPMFTNSYGPAGAWCWVVARNTGDKVLRFITFFLPLWLAIPYNTWVYFHVVRMLRYTMMVASSVSEEQRALEAKAVARLGYYPVILVLTWTFATLNRIQNFFSPTPIFWLYCAHVITSSLQGFLNAIAYGLNNSVRTACRVALAPHCPCLGDEDITADPSTPHHPQDDTQVACSPMALLFYLCPQTFRPPRPLVEMDQLTAELTLHADDDEDYYAPNTSPPKLQTSLSQGVEKGIESAAAVSSVQSSAGLNNTAQVEQRSQAAILSTDPALSADQVAPQDPSAPPAREAAGGLATDEVLMDVSLSDTINHQQ